MLINIMLINIMLINIMLILEKYSGKTSKMHYFATYMLV